MSGNSGDNLNCAFGIGSIRQAKARKQAEHACSSSNSSLQHCLLILAGTTAENSENSHKIANNL